MSALAGIDIALWDLKGMSWSSTIDGHAYVVQLGGWEFPSTNCLVGKSVTR